MENDVLSVPREAGLGDGEYILTSGVRCTYTIFSHSAFEKAVEALSGGDDTHKRLMRRVLANAYRVSAVQGKIHIPAVLFEHAGGESNVTVEFRF